MKNYKSKYTSVVLLSAIMASSAILASCKKTVVDDELLQPTTDTEVPPLSVSVAEGGESSELLENTTLDLFAIGADGSVLAKATATTTDQGQLGGAESVSAVMEDGIKLVAYSPAGLWKVDNFDQPVQFTVPADQSSLSAYQYADLQMAPPTVVKDGKVALVMNHVMAKVNIHVTDMTGDYDMSKAGLLMTGVKNTVIADLLNHEVTTVEPSRATADSKSATGDIVPYSTGSTPYRASASAIVAPTKMFTGDNIFSISIDGQTIPFKFSLTEDADWEGGKEITYTMRLTEDGLVSYGNQVTDWNDSDTELSGNLEGDSSSPETPPTEDPSEPSEPSNPSSSVTVGDFLLKDGSFVKADELTSSQVSNVVAIVFSTQVSSTDAAAGYNAYAMGIQRVTGKKYGLPNRIGDDISDFSKAFADLDGRTKTQQMKASADYSAVTDKASIVFGAMDEYSETYPLASAVASGWFVPSFGQMMQILNNLGSAAITADMEVEPNYSSPMYKSADNSVFNKVNTSVGMGSEIFPTSGGDTVFATSTEFGDANFWCVQTLTVEGAWNWAFGRNAGRTSSMGRSVLPCTAVKLP